MGSFCAQVDSLGNNLTKCNSSVFIGYNLRPKENDGINEIIIGTSVNGDGSNSAVLGNSSIARTRLQGQVLVGQFSVHPQGIDGAIYYNTLERKHFGFNGAEWIPFY